MREEEQKDVTLDSEFDKLLIGYLIFLQTSAVSS